MCADPEAEGKATTRKVFPLLFLRDTTYVNDSVRIETLLGLFSRNVLSQ